MSNTTFLPQYQYPIQSCMTLTDMKLTEFMGFTEKRAVTKLFIQ